MFRGLLSMAAAVIVLTGLAMSAEGAAAASEAAATPACSGEIQISRLAFNPPVVSPGQSSTISLIARNCTGQSLQTTAVWLGRFAGPGTGIPPGCPAIDPFTKQVNFAPFSTFTSSGSYLVPPGCTATELQVTVEFEEGGSVLAQRTADLIIVPPATAVSRPPAKLGIHR